MLSSSATGLAGNNNFPIRLKKQVEKPTSLGDKVEKTDRGVNSTQEIALRPQPLRVVGSALTPRSTLPRFSTQISGQLRCQMSYSDDPESASWATAGLGGSWRRNVLSLLQFCRAVL